MSWRTLARLRVPLGFACGVFVLWLAAPNAMSLVIGASVAALGQALRVWAAGHLDKNREVTTSGPYRLVQHPLYAGSALMAGGLAVACAQPLVAAVVVLYVAVTFTAAIRTERAYLAGRFGATYDAYRSGRGPAAVRRFSWARVAANREYRSVIGLALVVALLALRMVWT